MAAKDRKARKAGEGREPGLRGQGWRHITVLLNPETEKALRHQAIDEDRDISRILDDAIRAYLEKHRGGRKA